MGAMLDDGGGGGGGGDAGYTGRGPGSGDDPNPDPNYGPPPPPPYNPGPPAGGGYGGGGRGGGGGAPPPQPPPDIFADYLGPEVDMAKQETQQFLTNFGFPHGIDANQATLWILQHGLTNDFQAASASLFWENPQFQNADWRKANVWAQFGLDAATYHQRVGTASGMLEALTGMRGDESSFAFHDYASLSGWDQSEFMNSLLRQAVSKGWSQAQLLQAILDAGKGEVSGDHLVAQIAKDLLAAQPWLEAGSSFQQASTMFHSLYGSAPVDTPTLSSWWRFNTGVQQLTRGAFQVVETARPQPMQTETR
jgi:hypothetical protein